MPNVTFKEQEQVLKYRTDTMDTQTSTPNGLAIRQGLPHAFCVEDQTVLHTYFLGVKSYSEKDAHKPTPPRT